LQGYILSFGGISGLGWEWSGGETVPAVGGNVCRRLERRRAGTRPAPTGPVVGMAKTLWEAGEGRHKACPYGTG